MIFLVVQIRLPLRQIFTVLKLRYCGGSYYELVIDFEKRPRKALHSLFFASARV